MFDYWVIDQDENRQSESSLFPRPRCHCFLYPRPPGRPNLQQFCISLRCVRARYGAGSRPTMNLGSPLIGKIGLPNWIDGEPSRWVTRECPKAFRTCAPVSCGNISSLLMRTVAKESIGSLREQQIHYRKGCLCRGVFCSASLAWFPYTMTTCSMAPLDPFFPYQLRETTTVISNDTAPGESNYFCCMYRSSR